MLWFLIIQGAVLSQADHVFTAVARHEQLIPRSPNFIPSFAEQILLYATGLASDISHGARVSLHPNLPALATDDLAAHLKYMQCHGGKADLCFHDESTMLLAEQSWQSAEDFIIITQEPSCASPGEHATYIASYNSTNMSSICIELDAVPKTLKECSHQISLDVGSHVVPEVAPSLRPRQAVSTTPTATTSSNIQTASLSPTTSIGFLPPSVSPTATGLTYSITNFSYIDSTILPPPASIAAFLPTNYQPPQNLQLKCLNCTLDGSLSLNAINLNWTPDSDIIQDVDAAINFFNNGSLAFDANNLSANMSFELQFQPGITPEFVVKLPDIPVGGISIAGLVELGLILTPTFPLGVTFDSAVTFRTGFELEVPQNSQILLNVSQIDSSSVTGFQNSTIKPLPFSADAQDLSLSFFAGFQPMLILGAGVGDNNSIASASGGVGIFLNLPQLQTEVEMLHNVSDDCTGSPPAGVSNTFIHMKPAASFTFNDLLELEVGLESAQWKFGGSQTLFNYTVPLKDQCLQWDSKTNSMVPATNNIGNNTKNGTGTGTTKNEADRLMVTYKVTLGLLVALLGIFVVLA